MNKEYNQNPTEIQQGDTFDEEEYGNEWSGSWQVCGVCFERITQPILKGVWYHGSDKKYYDHEPVVATELEQVFEMMVSDIGRNKKAQCKCYFDWRDFMKLSMPEGFYGEGCYTTSNGESLCGRYVQDIHSLKNNQDAVLEKPTKQEYRCKMCINKLVRLKILKIKQHTGKSNNPIYNRLVWL